MTPRFAAIALALTLASAHAEARSPVEPPHISKPQPTVEPAASMPSLPPAAIDNSLVIGGSTVKAREAETRLSVEVRINGSGPYHFVVDSGADTSALGTRIANSLKLPLGTPVILNGVTSRDKVDRVKVASLTLGTTTMSNLELPVLREADLGSDGLIGIDALAQQRLMLDFDKHLINVEDARTKLQSVPGEIVIVGRRLGGQLILTQVRAGGLPLQAVIDTGSEITIGNTVLRDKLFRKHPDKFWTTKGIGVTGVEMQLQLARIDRLQIGSITLENVPIAFADVPPFALFGLAKEPSLILGTDILQSFRRVSLDFRARKVRFQLRTCRPEGVFISTTPESLYTRVSSNGTADICGR